MFCTLIPVVACLWHTLKLELSIPPANGILLESTWGRFNPRLPSSFVLVVDCVMYCAALGLPATVPANKDIPEILALC